MKLKKLEIYGFKSFAQKTEISFNDGITGIVGPNGSGKSNISDAVRWVLGEQSAKALRGSKMEDIIFNGTEKRKAMPYCEVSLVFENEDGVLNTSYSEVLVTRRAYRNGDSAYYLNKANCRLKDILELFRDTGIGKEGYSIIGQGRIDDILSAKGEERRQVFEEAAGIVTYRVRKEEAERKLSRTRENLFRVNDLIDEIAQRIDPLHNQAETAKKYLALMNRLKELEINIYLVRYDKLNERMDSLKAQMVEQKQQIDHHEMNITRLTTERSALHDDQETTEETLSQFRAVLSSVNERISSLQAAYERQKAHVEAVNKEALRLKEAVIEHENNLKELESLHAQSESDAKTQDSFKAEFEKKLLTEEKELERMVSASFACEKELDEHKQRILDAVNLMTDVKSMEARQQAMLLQMEKRFEEIEDNIQQIADKKAANQNNYELAVALREKEEKELALLLAEVQKLSDTFVLQEKELIRHKDEIRSLSDKLNHQTSRLSLMDEMSSAYEGYYSAVRKALDYSKNDPQVHGVIAKLIRVPRQFETAIDMILGGTLQHIITSDEETAKKLIDYLRINRLGRTTFLPLTAIKPRTLSTLERKSLSIQGCFGVACDLIECEPLYRPIIENILGRTVIVDHLQTAIAVMRSGQYAFNVVTLEGDVMRAGGAMTGGTTQNQSISLLSREREIIELKESVQKMKEELKLKQETLLTKNSAFDETSRLLSEAKDRLKDEEIALAREQERTFKAQTDLKATADEEARSLSALEQLKQSIDEIKHDLAAISSRSRHVSIDRESMDQDTEMLQQKMNESRISTEEQRNKVNRMKLEFSSLSHAIETLSRDKKRWQSEMALIRDKIQTFSSKQEENINLGKTEEIQLEDIQQNIQTSLAERVIAEQNVENTEANRKIILHKQRLCNDEIEISHGALSEVSGKYHRNEMVFTRTGDELQAMSDHVWNAYELTYASADAMRAAEPFELPSGEREASTIRSQIKEMGPINVQAIEEYTQTKDRYDAMVIQRDDAVKAENDLLDLINQLLGKMEKQFVEEFQKLNTYFSETFSRLFGGGKAELSLSDTSEPLTCGIEIVAQPPGKKLQLLSLLSGGERALTAIAILFAMLKLKPTPFCILDEIEAALDDANISYFADYLAEYAATTQFVVVTHRKGTMERCDALYGVAMQEKGISGMVSVNLENYS